MRAAALVVLLFLALPQAAAAHAVLVSATPERGTQVDAAPEQVTLRFNEPVEAGFGAVRVFDAEGERVDEGVRDPQVVLLETESGVLVDVESFVRAQYGYDVRCEVVGETGTLALPVPAATARGFEDRFAQAYRDELGAWVSAVQDGTPVGPGAWDGYAASAVTEACVRSAQTGLRTEVQLEPDPRLGG
mgnify:CR=1 FL=1